MAQFRPKVGLIEPSFGVDFKNQVSAFSGYAQYLAPVVALCGSCIKASAATAIMEIDFFMIWRMLLNALLWSFFNKCKVT